LPVVAVALEDIQVQLENLVLLHSVVELVLLIPVLLEQKILVVAVEVLPEEAKAEFLLEVTVDQA
jgi:hypothetical protein